MPIAPTRAAKGTLSATILAFALTACGDKPKPKGPPIPQAPQPTLQDDVAPEPPPVVKTAGGIVLDALVEAGPAHDAIIDAARRLSNDRAEAVKALATAGPAAKKVVLALLGSANLDEVGGALDVLATDGDPTQARAEAVGPVLALLSHEARVVREGAWAVAPLVADGERLATLLETASREDRVALVRLLASWDGPKVRAALLGHLRDSDAELAVEAALALTSSGRPVTPEVVAIAVELAQAEPTRALGLLLARRLPQSALTAHLAALTAAIDQALLSKESELVTAGLRATVLLALDERQPLLEQLAADPRPEVRRVATELLGTHGNPERAALTLDKLLDDPESAVRIAAIRSRAGLVDAIADPKPRQEAADLAMRALARKFEDGHRGVRLAAVTSLARGHFAAAVGPLIEAQLAREDDSGRELILSALALSKSRELVAMVIAKLGDQGLQAAAHLALQAASGKDFEANAAAWRPWLDETLPAPKVEAPPTPPGAPAPKPEVAPKTP